MSRYIDADKAKNGIMKFVNEYGEIVGMFVNDFNILLERCAADVQEVRHGRWIEQNNHDWEYSKEYRCSECGKYRLVTIPKGWNWHYCPNCGALMKGDTEND